ncbi:MAG: sodium:solute symporter family protein [Candidatus Hydrogenedentes bacterium]|nr:sodium:solute symporter family protein [Candidatus Hydrogenedentota bacterium]
MNLVLWGVLAYVLAQLLIGVLVSRSMKSESDYYLAGRRLGMGISTMTIFATWFGAETCIGSSGRIYSDGLSGGRADPFGYTLCILGMGLFFAVPFWKKQLTTLGDLFRIRYASWVESIAVIVIAPSSVIWAAAQIRAFGHVISVSSTFGDTIAITVAAVVVIVYTTMGGMLADAITDVIQGVALIVGLFVLGGAAYFAVGGFHGVVEAIEPSRLTVFSGGDESIMAKLDGWAVPIFGSMLAQELIARTLAAKSPSVARYSAFAASGLYFFVACVPLLLGLIGPSLVPGLEDSEQFLPTVAQKLLPTFMYVLFAGALISAILSTVDSALLAASALVSHNLIVPLLPNATDKKKVFIARATVAFFGLIAYVMAFRAEDIYDLVETASAFGSAGAFVVVVFALFTRFGGSITAVATLIVGCTANGIAEYMLELDYPYLMALAASLVTYCVFGIFDRARVEIPTDEAVTEGAEA